MSTEPTTCDEGGEAPCWAHLFADPTGPARPDIGGRDDIHVLVRDFYRQAAMDEILGPVFERAKVDWNVHIAVLIDFWSWQLLGERGYEGNPLRAHEPLHERTPFTAAHYERWLELFSGTIDDHFAGPVAELAKGRGAKMAAAMRRLLDHGAEGGSDPGSAPAEPRWVASTR